MPRGGKLGDIQPSHIRVCGHGIKGNVRTCDDSGNPLRSYSVWYNMIRRCYGNRGLKRYRAYIGCAVSNEWKVFSAFKRWYDANYREGFHLDKDILVPSNKIYSASTCVFVPPYINIFIKKSTFRDLPRGVCLNKKRYQARCERDGKGKKCLGTFDTPEEASAAYQKYRRKHVIKTATRYYLAGDISLAVRNALIDIVNPMSIQNILNPGAIVPDERFVALD